MKWQSTSLIIKKCQLKRYALYFWEDEVEMFSPIPPAKNREEPWTSNTKHFEKTLKCGEKKADQLETPEPEGQQGGEFSGFSSCLTHPRLGAGEVGNQEMSRGTDKESPGRVCF